MQRRSSYRPVGDESGPGTTGPGRARRGRRRSGPRRRGALASTVLGVALTGVLVSMIVVQSGRSDAAAPLAPGVAAAMTCVRGWLGQPVPTMAGGAGCFAGQQGSRRAHVPDSASSAAATDVAPPSWSASASASPSASASAAASSDDASAAPTASATPTDAPSSSASASASASPSADASPPSTSSPTPTSSDSPSSGTSDSDFGSAPLSGVISCKGRSGVTISGHTFKGIGNDQPAIVIDGCTDVVIRNNDFIDDTEPIYVVNSRNVRIIGNRYRNITGPHTRNGSHRGNFTQWENSFGGEISDNVGVGGDTEDVVSIYKSGGLSAAQPLVIQRNVFRGRGWTSSSGSGFMLGDGGGSHIVVRDNTLIDVGQVGIGVAGGSDIHVLGNTILGSPLPNSNVGVYVWGQGGGCGDIEVSGNRIDFKKQSGLSSPLWNGGNCGAVSGWSTNVFPTLQLAPLVSRLAEIG